MKKDFIFFVFFIHLIHTHQHLQYFSIKNKEDEEYERKKKLLQNNEQLVGELLEKIKTKQNDETYESEHENKIKFENSEKPRIRLQFNEKKIKKFEIVKIEEKERSSSFNEEHKKHKSELKSMPNETKNKQEEAKPILNKYENEKLKDQESVRNKYFKREKEKKYNLNLKKENILFKKSDNDTRSKLKLSSDTKKKFVVVRIESNINNTELKKESENNEIEKLNSKESSKTTHIENIESNEELRDYYNTSSHPNKHLKRYPNQQNLSFIERLREEKVIQQENKHKNFMRQPPPFLPLLRSNYIKDMKTFKHLFSLYIDPESDGISPRKYEQLINLAVKIKTPKEYPTEYFFDSLDVKINKSYEHEYETQMKLINERLKEKKLVFLESQKAEDLIRELRTEGFCSPKIAKEEKKTYILSNDDIEHFKLFLKKKNLTFKEIRVEEMKLLQKIKLQIEEREKKEQKDVLYLKKKEAIIMSEYKKEIGKEEEETEEKYLSRLEKEYKYKKELTKQESNKHNLKPQIRIIALKKKYCEKRIHKIEHRLEIFRSLNNLFQQTKEFE